MATLKLCIEGMRGPDDEGRIEAALREEHGVLGAIANHRDACAEVEYEDDEVALDEILAVVEGLGYRAALGG